MYTLYLCTPKYIFGCNELIFVGFYLYKKEVLTVKNV